LSSFAIFFMPGGTGATGLHIPISSPVFPLFFYTRVTAFDAQGRMVNRVNDYMRTDALAGNATHQTYEPMGGALEALDPYPEPHNAPPLTLPPMLSRDDAFALLGSFLGGGAPSTMTKLGSSPSAVGAPGPTRAELAPVLASLGKDPRLSRQALV